MLFLSILREGENYAKPSVVAKRGDIEESCQDIDKSLKKSPLFRVTSLKEIRTVAPQVAIKSGHLDIADLLDREQYL